MKLPINYEDAHWLDRKAAREQYVIEQGGMCHHCGEPLGGPPAKAVREKSIKWRLFPPNFRKFPVHLHHSHKTGMTIGAVHNRCNAFLWQYRGE